MPTFSAAFDLNKNQAQLDFVDILLETDIPLFIDPFALSQRLDRFSVECHRTLIAFFQQLVDDIRKGRLDHAKELLSYLREPNETRLGLSDDEPQGAGIGRLQAQQIFNALQQSAAVQTGFLSSLEEAELLIEGISRDKISDLTTNVIRGRLVDYTIEQCKLHGVALNEVPLRTQRPGSIYELAKALKRDLKNVQGDLRILEKYGLVRMTEGRGTGKRRVKVPEALFGEIALKIAI